MLQCNVVPPFTVSALVYCCRDVAVGMADARTEAAAPGNAAVKSSNGDRND